MNCTDFRQQLIASPDGLSATMRAHADGCDRCSGFAGDLMALDTVIHAAFAVQAPASLGQPQLARRFARRRRRAVAVFAAAASLLVAAALGTLLALDRDPAPMPKALVAHILHEPLLLEPTQTIVPVERVSHVLREGRVLLKGNPGRVSHAGLCEFRGRLVAHLVVDTPGGPVTVMLLPDETVAAPLRFDEGGLRGVVVPSGRGSIAVLGDGQQQIDAVREHYSSVVEYSI